jgi:hypothetical protein
MRLRTRDDDRTGLRLFPLPNHPKHASCVFISLPVVLSAPLHTVTNNSFISLLFLLQVCTVHLLFFSCAHLECPTRSRPHNLTLKNLCTSDPCGIHLSLTLVDGICSVLLSHVPATLVTQGDLPWWYSPPWTSIVEKLTESRGQRPRDLKWMPPRADSILHFSVPIIWN